VQLEVREGEEGVAMKDWGKVAAGVGIAIEGTNVDGEEGVR